MLKYNWNNRTFFHGDNLGKQLQARPEFRGAYLGRV